MALDRQEFFIADQVRLPELFFTEGPPNSADHCFHQFDSIEMTGAPADDRQLRSIDDFVQEVEHAGRMGCESSTHGSLCPKPAIWDGGNMKSMNEPVAP